MIDKKNLSERDICTKFITPAVEKSGWNKMTQLLEEVSFTDGKIYVRGKLTARGKQKRADYILYYKPNIPIAIIEAKDNKHIPKAINYAIRYKKKAETVWQNGIYNNKKEYVFTNLEPETVYEFRVAAQGSDGMMSDMSAPITIYVS